MSYFDDQWEAWNDNGCQGDPTEYNPDEYWGDKIMNCDHKRTKMESIEKDNGKTYRAKVCKNCQVIL